MKNKLRKIALQTRKELDIKTLSGNVLKNLFSLEEYKKANNILCYFPLKYEIQTQSCLEDSSKTWFLPRVNGEDLDVCPYKKDELVIGSFNIQEPSSPKIENLALIEMVIIPAVAGDKKGYRLGYGKGFYDRFLPKLSVNCKKVVLLYSNFLFDTVCPDYHDVKSDFIVTDKEIFRF